MDLDIRTVDHDDDTIVTIAGELDILTAPALGHAVDTLVGAGRVRLTVDLSGLAFCDSTGIGAFVRASNECHREGGYLRLADPCDTVVRILAIVGLLDAFPTFRTVAAARQGDRSALVMSPV